jgi:hypothetical protein
MGQAGITRYGCCAYVQRIWTSSYAPSTEMQFKFRVRSLPGLRRLMPLLIGARRRRRAPLQGRRGNSRAHFITRGASSARPRNITLLELGPNTSGSLSRDAANRGSGMGKEPYARLTLTSQNVVDYMRAASPP